MNLSSVAILAGVAAEAWLIALLVLRGRRHWLQAAYAACAFAFLVAGVSFVGTNEGLLPPPRDDVLLGLTLLGYALAAVLVLGLIHGETLPRRRAATFLLLAPVPVLALLAPSQGWTVASAFEGNAPGGFVVLCLGLPLAEAIYARTTSPLLAPHAFWLSIGVVALIVGGPVYTYELLILGLTPFAGANAAAPVALACLARVALRTDPFPIVPRTRPGRKAAGELHENGAIVLEETRAKYARRMAAEEAAAGRGTLVIGRKAPPAASGIAFASIDGGRDSAIRTLTTASEFFSAARGSLVVLSAVADLSAVSGWRPTREALVRLHHTARRMASTAVVCPTRLTESERQGLGALRLPTWTLPDPAIEIVAILSQSFGTGADRLFESFCRAHGLRRDDITTDHVPAVLAFLSKAFDELSGAVGDAAAHGLRVQFEAAASVLRTFERQGAREIARGKWPSRKAVESDSDLLVTAADYWKGKEMDELFAAADAVVEREPLFEKARLVFVEQLGDAGEGLLRTELARLGKRPEDLERKDLVRIADRATVDLGTMADVVDVPAERARIQKQIESIRARLELIAEASE